MLSSRVRLLHDLTPADIPLAGGKACRLGVLAREGLPVPKGLVVAVGTPAGETLAAELEAALAAAGIQPDAPVAVRSSSPGEDGGYRSAAGVYESHLNVRGPRAILEAVRHCQASVLSDRARAYGAEHGSRMAVLVQELVPCEVAGILFTLDPLAADENEMLVEATWGLAAELASGEVTPDRFVIDFWDGRCRTVEAGNKPEALYASVSGGLERKALPGEKAARPCLEPPQLEELAKAGRQVQEIFGRPQDVEFGFAGGKLYILQTRPITSYAFPASTGQWTTANFREVMPGFASLLGQSQSFHHDFALSQEEVFRRLRLWRQEDEGVVWSRTFFGHGYWNVGATKRIVARIPGYSERSFDRTVGIDPVYDGEGVRTPWNLRTIARGIPVMLALSREYRKVPEEASAFIAWYEREEPAWDGVDPSRLDDAELARWVSWGLDLHWRANRWALLTSLLSTQAQEDFHGTLDGLSQKVPEADRPSEARLLTGLTGMATARPLHDLWRLARDMAGHPEAVMTLRRESAVELQRRLAEPDARNGDVWGKVRDWIKRYRYMSNIDEDLSVPRWWEDPSVPLTMLRGFVLDGGATGEAAPDQQVERQRRVREDEEKKALVIGKRWAHFGLDPFWMGRFRRQYDRVKSLSWWREETRVYLSRARYHSRRFLVEQARRWGESGKLSDACDIFWLTRDEILALVGEAGGPAAPPGPPGGAGLTFAVAQELARRRRRMASLFRNFPVPPNILPGSFGSDGLPKTRRKTDGGPNGRPNGATAMNGPAAGMETSGEPGGGLFTLAGVGCSAGEATGKCRVARRIEEAAGLEPGEILVASYANPAWTPLFHLAAGLVLEEGGLLSHSAVVAREYGVPAVLQVKDATRRLKTGDVVTVDGLLGTVVARSGR